MKKYFPIILFFVFFGSAFGQDEDIFGIDTKARTRSRKADSNVGNVTRNIMSTISFEFSGGGAYHTQLIDFNAESPAQYPISQYQNLENPRELTSEDTIRFRGGNVAFPLNVGIRLNVFNTLTLGGGYGREFGSISNLKGEDYEFIFERGNYTFDKLYGTVALVLYDSRKRAKFLNWRYRKFASNNLYMQSEKNQRIRQNYPWKFLLEGEFGNLTIRKNFDDRVLTDGQGYYGIGLRIEKEFSEYTRVFIKTGAEFRNFIYQAENLVDFQNLKQTLYIAQVGFSINLPGTKRCKVPGCGVVMKHLHDGVEYRGSSIFNLQNRKVGQWY
ncbi:hypothetical protein EF405_07535 [Cyclobacteriaceae bacterium YHN15]|nr:hypothetical protein EF405_07535 [Cyclobacteriaceae bacterium YHN15]